MDGCKVENGETRPLMLSLRCFSQIDAADLSHVICTQGVNSIINSRCRYYNSGYNGLAKRPCSAQLKLDSSDVNVDVGISSCDIFLALLSDMGKMLPLPLSSLRRFVYPVKS
jgi:hypothetical protein